MKLLLAKEFSYPALSVAEGKTWAPPWAYKNDSGSSEKDNTILTVNQTGLGSFPNPTTFRKRTI